MGSSKTQHTHNNRNYGIFTSIWLWMCGASMCIVMHRWWGILVSIFCYVSKQKAKKTHTHSHTHTPLCFRFFSQWVVRRAHATLRHCVSYLFIFDFSLRFITACSFIRCLSLSHSLALSDFRSLARSLNRQTNWIIHQNTIQLNSTVCFAVNKCDVIVGRVR